jgi:hypothetical protein
VLFALKLKLKLELGMVVHTYDPSTQEVEAEQEDHSKVVKV